jgi:hypothetical protein
VAATLIRLQDGILVEVETPSTQVQQISGGSAELVENNLENIRPLLVRLCRPIAAAWQDLQTAGRIEGAEVEVGLSFEAEGNLYIAKSKLGAHLIIKFMLSPG